MLHHHQCSGPEECFLLDAACAGRPMSVAVWEGANAVLIVDDLTGDDIAEVFHCDLHSVAQTPDHAAYMARLFAASHKMLSALIGLVAVRPVNHADDDDPEARDAWQAASAAIAAAGVPA